MWQVCREKMLIILIGSVGGLSVFITLAYVISLLIPLTTLSLLVQLTLYAIASTILLNMGGWKHWKESPLYKDVLLVFIVTFALFSIITPKLLISQETGLYTGIINAYGDVAWHLSNITLMAEGQLWPLENPIFAGTRLTYPFLVNFFSALLIVGGASLSSEDFALIVGHRR
jgi:hypothetical protein